MVEQVSGHLNKLIDTINDVKTNVKAKTYGFDPSVPLVTPGLVSLIKVQIHGAALETISTTDAFDDVVKELTTL